MFVCHFYSYFVYIKPLSVEVRAKIAEKNSYTQVLNRVNEIKVKRDAIFAEYDSISLEEIDRLNKVVPAKINSVALLNDLSVIGARHNVSIKDFKVTDSENTNRDVVGSEIAGSYRTTSMHITLLGQYEDFLKFLGDIERSLSLIDVVTLGILPGSPTKSGAAGPMQITLEANTYSLR